MSNDPGDDRLAFYLKAYLYFCIAAMYTPLIVIAVMHFCGYSIFHEIELSVPNLDELISKTREAGK